MTARVACIPSIPNTISNHFSTQLTVTLNKKLSFLLSWIFFLFFATSSWNKKCWSIFAIFIRNKHKKWINCTFRVEKTKSGEEFLSRTEIPLRDKNDKQFLVNLIFLLVVWFQQMLVRLIFSHFIVALNPTRELYLFNSYLFHLFFIVTQVTAALKRRTSCFEGKRLCKYLFA